MPDGRTLLSDLTARMEGCRLFGDAAYAHQMADEILCEAITTMAALIGVDHRAYELVAEFQRLEKWYA